MISFLSYFNLNDRVLRTLKKSRFDEVSMLMEVEMLPPSKRRAARKRPAAKKRAAASHTKRITPSPPPPPHMSLWEQLLLYFGTVIGVIFSSAVMQFEPGESISINISWASVLISSVVALVIMPIAFEKLRVGSDSPFIFRIGLFVQHGVFWQVLFGAAGKAV